MASFSGRQKSKDKMEHGAYLWAFLTTYALHASRYALALVYGYVQRAGCDGDMCGRCLCIHDRGPRARHETPGVPDLCTRLSQGALTAISIARRRPDSSSRSSLLSGASRLTRASPLYNTVCYRDRKGN